MKKELSKEEYAKLKGVMWVLRKKDLDEKDKALLNKLFKHSTSLKIAYMFQNNLTKIFDTKTSRSAGKRWIKNWIIQVENSCLV